MKFIFPDNIFSRLISDALVTGINAEIEYHPSSVLSAELKKNPDAIALIPVMDLINHRELFVSSKYGISFENLLSNSYIYYAVSEKTVKEIHLAGDISSQEVLLARIVFKELYDAEIQLHLLTDTSPASFANKNLILSGDLNFADNRFAKGISFAEELIESLNLPYVNYVFAAATGELLTDFHKEFSQLIEAMYANIENFNFGENFPEPAKEYIKSNISSLIIEFDQQDLEGLEQLTRLPYFHGMIENIVDVKYVS